MLRLSFLTNSVAVTQERLAARITCHSYPRRFCRLHYTPNVYCWCGNIIRSHTVLGCTVDGRREQTYAVKALQKLSPDDAKSDSDSSLGSSVVVLPCNESPVSDQLSLGDHLSLTDHVILTDEVSLTRGSDSELRDRSLSSPGSSVVVVGESAEESGGEGGAEGEAGGGELAIEGLRGVELRATELHEEDPLYTAATELWLSSTDQCSVKRRRVHSEPSPSSHLLSAGLTHSALFDQLSDLVGVQRTSDWGSDISPPPLQLGVTSWGSEQGSFTAAPPPSTASDQDSATSSDVISQSDDVISQSDDVSNPPRTTYTDEVLNEVFRDMLNNIEAYNTEYEVLAAGIRRLVEENEHIKGRVYLLEWECDNLRQEALSNRILIINVPTKLTPLQLSQLVIRVAHRVGVFLHLDDIRDVFYLFRRPSRTSPVIVIFMEHALGARRQILARKNKLQHLPMRTLEGFGRYSNTICVDEQLIGRRNELKQAARRVMKQGRVLDTWVLNGNVYVRDHGQRKHLIESEEALDTVLRYSAW